MYIWTGLTAFFWLAYIVMRITVGKQCRFVPTASNFVQKEYLGRWYEFARSKSVPTSWEKCDCATATYVDLPQNYIQVNNVEFCLDTNTFRDSVDDTYTGGGTAGRAQCSRWHPGLCNVQFFFLAPWADYEIIALDLNDYAIVYSCSPNFGGALTLEYMWMLTRTPLKIGSAERNAMEDKLFGMVREMLPKFDLT